MDLIIGEQAGWLNFFEHMEGVWPASRREELKDGVYFGQLFAGRNACARSPHGAIFSRIDRQGNSVPVLR